MSLQVWLPLNGSLENRGLEQNYKIEKAISGYADHTTLISNTINGKVTPTSYKWELNGQAISINKYMNQLKKYSTYSISCWLYYTDKASHEAMAICSSGDWNIVSGKFNFALWGHNGTGYTKILVPSTVAAWNGAVITLNNPSTIQPNKWYHLCLTCDSKMFKLYVNGILQENQYDCSQNSTIPSSPSDENLFIGCATYYNGMTIKGSINDFRIYDHCLSPREVKLLAQGLVAHYKLDSANSYDCSGHGNHLLQVGNIIIDNTSPRYSCAVDFNQTGYFKTDNFNLTAQQFTCAFWLKAPPNIITDQHFLFGTHNNWTGNGFSAWRDKNGSSYSVIIKSSAETSHLGSSFSFNTNTWEHIVYTYTGTELIGYRNGVEFKRNTYGKNGNVILPVVYLGNSLFSNAAASEIDEASMSDFRIYATALSAAAVKELYQSSISFLDNGTLQCSEIVENSTNLKYNQNGMVQAELISEVGYTNKMKIKTLSDGSAWARIHWLDVTTDATYFPDAAEVQECTDKTNRFSMLKSINHFYTSCLPTGYQRLDYIQPGGTYQNSPYIDTGIIPDNNTKIVLSYAHNDGNEFGALFGARIATTDSVFGAWIGDSGG